MSQIRFPQRTPVRCLLWASTGETRNTPGRCNPSGAISGSAARSSIPPRPSSLGLHAVGALSWPAIAVALEQSRGALVFMLAKYAHLHLYPIHPRAAAQFRAALYPSGAKDDPVDGDMLLELVAASSSPSTPPEPDTEQTRLVQHLVEARRKLVNEKTRQVQRLDRQAETLFSQVLDWFEKVDSPLVGALLLRWPTLEELQKARPATLRSFLTQHNCRSQELIDSG